MSDTDEKTAVKDDRLVKIEKNLYKRQIPGKKGHVRYIVKYKKYYHSFPTKKAAQEALAKVKAERGGSTITKKMTIAAAIDNWFKNDLSKRDSETTLARRRSTANTHIIPAIGMLQIGALRREDVIAILDNMEERNYSYSSCKKAYELINGCYKYLLSIRAIDYNPIAGIIVSKKHKKPISAPTTYTVDELFQIMKELEMRTSDGNYKYVCAPVVRLGLNTGMRIGELLALRWENVQLGDKNTIKVCEHLVMIKNKPCIIEGAKTSTGVRTISLNTHAQALLEELKKGVSAPSGLVFRSKTGTPLRYNTVRRSWKKALNNAGIDPSKIHGLHSIRHTFASALISRAEDVKKVSELLGHSSVRITYDIYTHFLPSDLDSTVRVMDDIFKTK